MGGRGGREQTEDGQWGDTIKWPLEGKGSVHNETDGPHNSLRMDGAILKGN